MKFLMKFLIMFLAIFFILSCLNTDSTDRGFKKSDLGLYIDNATGCHYLKGGIFGDLTLRLDRHGNHICGGWEYEKQLKEKYNEHNRSR